ncbi:methyl-accepting chemotaxis protein, partial [Pseudomonas sp. FSL R10-0071]
GLNTFFSANAADTLRALSDAMAEYTQALQVFTDTDNSIIDRRKDMTDYGNGIVSRSTELYNIQLERRDTDSASANRLQLITTLLVLLLGVV